VITAKDLALRGEARDRTVLRYSPALNQPRQIIAKPELEEKHRKTVHALKWCSKRPNSKWQVLLHGTAEAAQVADKKDTVVLGDHDDVIHFLRTVRRLAAKRGLDGRFFHRTVRGPAGS